MLPVGRSQLLHRFKHASVQQSRTRMTSEWTTTSWAVKRKMCRPFLDGERAKPYQEY